MGNVCCGHAGGLRESFHWQGDQEQPMPEVRGYARQTKWSQILMIGTIPSFCR